MNKLHLLDILEHSIGCQVVWVRISARGTIEIFYLCSKMSEASSGKSKAGGWNYLNAHSFTNPEVDSIYGQSWSYQREHPHVSFPCA